MIAPAPVLEMRAVTKSFPSPRGRVDVLCGVDLAIQRGEFVAVTGPSGSGKSTLLHLAALLDQPTSGEVLLEGTSFAGNDPDAACEVRMNKIGMIFQRFHLLPHRSALENVLFRFRYTDRDAAMSRRDAEAALERVGMLHAADRPARLLSGGEMQRVAVARAVALRPALLVADEPTGNLDHASATIVMDHIRDLNREGLPVLLVTHNPTLLAYCNRHHICDEGRLKEHALL